MKNSISGRIEVAGGHLYGGCDQRRPVIVIHRPAGDLACRAGHRSASLCVLSSGMRVGLVFDKAPITDGSEQRRRVHCGPDPGLHGNTAHCA